MMQRLLLSVLLFTSGLCGIAYEILYGRLLANIIGDQFVVSTAVLLTFLLGIGFGALHAHRWWRHLGAVEAGIGIYAVLFALNLPAVESFLYAQLPNMGTSVLTSLLVAIVLLAVPAFLIGISLPLFAAYAHHLRASEGYFAKSYGLYNLGAALTVIFIEFWLIRQTGITHAVYYMAALNVAVAFFLILFFRPVSQNETERTSGGGTGFPRAILVALAVSAVGSAIFQLTALRLGELLFGPYRETFAYVLCVVLLGIAIGSLLVNRLRIGFTTLMLFSILALCWTMGGLYWVMHQYSQYFALVKTNYWELVALRFACIAALTLGPAIAFGATIPALLNTLSVHLKAGDRALARSPGYLLYIASLANAAGFLLMCLVLHKRLDYGDLIVVVVGFSAMSIVVVAVMSEVKGIATTRHGLRWWGVVIGLVALVVGSRLQWNEELLYQGHKIFESDAFTKLETSADTWSERYKGEQDVLSISRRNGVPFFIINGKISIQLNKPSEKLVGAIGGVFSQDNRKALVLGVGSGATAASVGLLFDEVEAVEISGVILDNLHRLKEYNFGIIEMPNVKLIHDDALHAVRVAQGDYSLILNTVTSPLFFSSSKLYTTDFLEQVRDKLAPGGVYMTWLDSRVGDRGADIMVESVTEVFEHCGLAQITAVYLLMLCSDAPIVAHQPQLVAEQTQLAAYFREGDEIDPQGIAYQLLTTNLAALRNPQGAPLNRLDKPVLAFEMARVSKRGMPELKKRIAAGVNLQEIDEAFRYFDWSLPSMLDAMREVSGRNSNYDAFYEKYKSMRALTREAKTAEQAGDCEAAVEALSGALAIEGRSGNTGLALARCYEINGEHATALAAYRLEQESQPESVSLALVIGRVLIWQEHYEAALQEFQKVPTADRSGAYHFMVGQALSKLGRGEEAHQHEEIAQRMSGSLKRAASGAMNISGEPD
ncbi:MAG: spermidine synthase [Halioglobus sp.]|jgi:spermidine synthase